MNRSKRGPRRRRNRQPSNQGADERQLCGQVDRSLNLGLTRQADRYDRRNREPSNEVAGDSLTAVTRDGDDFIPKPSTDCCITDLPDELLYLVFTYLSSGSLCVVSQVCRQFNRVASHDGLWLHLSKQCSFLFLSANDTNTRLQFKVKEQYKIAENWMRGDRMEGWVLSQKCKLLPWVQKVDETLWLSRGNQVVKYDIRDDGQVTQNAGQPLNGLSTDVTRFVVKNGLVVSGCRGGGVSTWEASSGEQLMTYKAVHQSDAQAVDIVNDIIISGSRDQSVKLLSSEPNDAGRVKKTFEISDRVWSLSASPNKSHVAVGTACYNNCSVVLLDIDSGKVVGRLGDDHKMGAGVLDVAFESPNTLLTCGYDTTLRAWDVRSLTCVRTWADPYDSAVYCLQSDGNNAMITGTARHGRVVLWDKRKNTHLRDYDCGGVSSPVYSLACCLDRLYVALDKGLFVLNFSAV